MLAVLIFQCDQYIFLIDISAQILKLIIIS